MEKSNSCKEGEVEKKERAIIAKEKRGKKEKKQ